MLKKQKILKIVFLNLAIVISLIGCSTKQVVTDDFHLWGEPICLNEDEKNAVSYKNLIYYLKHNEMLGVISCKDLKNNNE